MQIFNYGFGTRGESISGWEFPNAIFKVLSPDSLTDRERYRYDD
jgi:hypothetical protein